MKRRLIAGAVACAALASVTPACSDHTDHARAAAAAASTTTVPRVTDEQASAIADALAKNYSAGQAGFKAVISAGSTETLAGVVDWEGHHVEAVIGSDGTTLVTDGTNVAILKAGTDEWTTEPFDAKSSMIETTMALIAGSASTQRDNPVLIRSNGAVWLGGKTYRVNDTELTLDESGRVAVILFRLASGQVQVTYDFG